MATQGSLSQELAVNAQYLLSTAETSKQIRTQLDEMDNKIADVVKNNARLVRNSQFIHKQLLCMLNSKEVDYDALARVS